MTYDLCQNTQNLFQHSSIPRLVPLCPGRHPDKKKSLGRSDGGAVGGRQINWGHAPVRES